MTLIRPTQVSPVCQGKAPLHCAGETKHDKPPVAIGSGRGAGFFHSWMPLHPERTPN